MNSLLHANNSQGQTHGYGRDAMSSSLTKTLRGSLSFSSSPATTTTTTIATTTPQDEYPNIHGVLHGNPVEEYFRHLDVLSAPWWVRLAEGDRKPQSRRAHSATIFEVVNRETKNDSIMMENDHTRKLSSSATSTSTATTAKMQEYMIVTGGFTDSDWKTFPVWAYDMTLATTANDGRWYNLTPPVLSDHECHGYANANASANATKVGMKYSQPCGPTSRVGHISVVREGILYVFGGLQYSDIEGVFLWKKIPTCIKWSCQRMNLMDVIMKTTRGSLMRMCQLFNPCIGSDGYPR
jgi:hypothetical protein